MHLIAVLLLTFTLAGEPAVIQLRTTAETCRSDIMSAQQMLRNLHAQEIKAVCLIEAQ